MSKDASDLLDGRTLPKSTGADALQVRLAQAQPLRSSGSAATKVREAASLLKIRRDTTAAAGVEWLGVAELLGVLADRDPEGRIHVHHFTDECRIYAVYESDDRSILGVTAIVREESGPIDETGSRL